MAVATLLTSVAVVGTIDDHRVDASVGEHEGDCRVERLGGGSGEQVQGIVRARFRDGAAERGHRRSLKCGNDEAARLAERRPSEYPARRRS